MKTKEFVLTSLFSLSMVFGYAQFNNELGDINPPTPTASAFGQYSEVPVSLHTGLANIGIPIYTLSDGPLNHSVSLSYHSSGIKVNQTASWAGIGWNVNAGGVITRSVRGGPDEGRVYLGSNDAFPCGWYSTIRDGGFECTTSLPLPMDPGQISKYLDADAGRLDLEPDVFFFNFDGYSGKFFFDEQGIPQTIPKMDIQITPNYDEEFISWEIVVPNGNRYHFGRVDGQDAIERTRTYNYRDWLGDRISVAGKYPIPNTWHLVRIEDPNRVHSIRFEYEVERYQFRDLEQETGWGVKELGYVWTPPPALTYSFIVTEVEGYRLKKISTPFQKIEFISGAKRKDLDWSFGNYVLTPTITYFNGRPNGGNAPKVLDKIEIQGRNGSCLKEFKFKTDYFISDRAGFNSVYDGSQGVIRPDRYRLRLRGLIEQSCDGGLKKEHDFEYYHEDFPDSGVNLNLPRRLSYAQDHWGYYNGEDDNRSLFPKGIFPKEACYFENPLSSTYGTRESSFPEMQIGSLSKITYPTGGFQRFEYEPHQIPKITTECSKGEVKGGEGTCGTGNNYLPSFQFLVTADQVQDLKIELKLDNIENFCEEGAGTMEIIAYDSNNQQLGRVLHAAEDMVKICPLSELGVENPGIYRFEGTVTGAYGQYEVYHEVCQVVNGIREIGGLRIKRIEGDPAGGPKVEKNYLYEDGVLLAEPQYITDLSIPILQPLFSPVVYPGNPNCSAFDQIVTTSSVSSLASTQGSHFGYKKVKVEQPGNGHSEYEYYLSPDASDYGYFPIPPEPKLDLRRGLLKEERHVNTDGDVLKEVVNDWEVEGAGAFYATGQMFRVYSATSCVAAFTHTNNLGCTEIEITNHRTKLAETHILCSEASGQNIPAQSFIAINNNYELESGYVLLTQSTETVDGVQKVTTYDYNASRAHLFPTKETFTNTDGRKIENVTKYAHEIGDDNLLDKFMIGIPIETQVLVNEQQVGGRRTTYDFIEGSEFIVAIDSILLWEGSAWDSVGIYAAHNGQGYVTTFDKTYYDDHEQLQWQDNLLKRRAYKGFVTEYDYFYETNRLLKRVIKVDGTYTEFTYDGLQRLKTMKEYGNQGGMKSTTTIDYQYRNGGGGENIVEMIITYPDAPTKTSVKTYDGLGRYLQTLMLDYGPGGSDVVTDKVVYDNGISRIKSKTYLPGSMTDITYERSPLNRVEKEVFPGEGEVMYKYDNQGGNFRQTFTDEKGQETQTFTDLLGRTVLVVDAMGGNLQYLYDDWGNIEYINTPEGNQYSYTYDYGQNHLMSKTIPGGGTTYFDYYDDRDLLLSQTDPNGILLSYEYDIYDRVLKTFDGALGSEVFIENFYYSGEHVDKIRRIKNKVLGESGYTYDNYTYDEFGRAVGYGFEHLVNKDSTIYVIDKADRTLNQTLIHKGFEDQSLTILGATTFDTYDRSLKMYHQIVGEDQQLICDNQVYNARNELMVKQIGDGLQTFNYTYHQRGWLQLINKPLGAGQALAVCEKIEVAPPPIKVKPSSLYTDTTIVDVNLLLQLRSQIRIKVANALDSINCRVQECEDPICSTAEANQQQQCLNEAIEIGKTLLGSTQVIPCEDGSTEEVWVPDTSSITYPIDIVRVRLCDGTEYYLLESTTEALCGPVEEQQTITVASSGQLFPFEEDGALVILTAEELFKWIGVSSPPPLGGHTPCGTVTCEDEPLECSEAIVLIQNAALELLKEEIPQVTAETLPDTLFEMLTCEGDYFYILEEEYSVVEETEMEVVDTIIIDSLNQDIPISFLPKDDSDCKDLFYLKLDHEPNGNIENQVWQVATRNPMQYKLEYDPLNRLQSAKYSESAGSQAATAAGRYSLPGITYDRDGNIKTLSRNGIIGQCSNGAPEYGKIDALEYNYDHETAPNRVQSITDGSGREQGFNPGAGTGPYEYDSVGNLTIDPYKQLSITYNFLNLPSEIKKGGDVISIIYDASGRKLRQIFTPQEGEGVQLDYMSGVEYRNQELNATYHQEGRVFLAEGERQYEYFIRDHLGNTRLVVADLNGDGCIDPLSDPSEILQEHHYYPFGLNMDGPWARQYQEDEDGETLLDDEGNPIVDHEKLNRYQYNGKELTSDLGLNWNDYGARWYDPAVGRWNAVDPLAEDYYNISSYAYVANNPLLFIDPDGKRIEIGDLVYTPGMETSEDYDEFTNNSITALNYIYENGGKKEVKRLSDSEESTYTFLQSKEEGSRFVASATEGGTIFFNDTEGREFEGGDQSPVVVLAHELDHASQNEKLLSKARKSGKYDDLIAWQTAEAGSEATEREEQRAVDGLERKISRAIGHYGRKNYYEKILQRFIADGPLKIY